MVYARAPIAPVASAAWSSGVDTDVGEVVAEQRLYERPGGGVQRCPGGLHGGAYRVGELRSRPPANGRRALRRLRVGPHGIVERVGSGPDVVGTVGLVSTGVLPYVHRDFSLLQQRDNATAADIPSAPGGFLAHALVAGDPRARGLLHACPPSARDAGLLPHRAAAGRGRYLQSLSSPCYRRVAGGPLSVLLGDQALNRDSARWCQGHLMVGQERAGLVLEQPAPVHGVPGTGVGVLRSLAEPATLTPAAWRGRTR
jgi:hypothetical protein